MNFVCSYYLGILSALEHSVEQLGNASSTYEPETLPQLLPCLPNVLLSNSYIDFFFKTDVCLIQTLLYIAVGINIIMPYSSSFWITFT